MRVPIYTVAVPLLAAFAFAQDTQPKQPAQPAAADQTSKDKKSDKQMDSAKGAAQASSDRLPELKTQTYSGTLVDASCAGAASTASAPSTSADRAAPSAGNSSCTVSASTTQFALQLQDGKTVKFDDVGNMRAQEAFKAHKKWGDSAAANKAVRVKASGVLDGDKLTVMSVN